MNCTQHLRLKTAPRRASSSFLRPSSIHQQSARSYVIVSLSSNANCSKPSLQHQAWLDSNRWEHLAREFAVPPERDGVASATIYRVRLRVVHGQRSVDACAVDAMRACMSISCMQLPEWMIVNSSTTWKIPATMFQRMFGGQGSAEVKLK